MALRNHLIHVDELIALQDSRLRGLQEEFQRDLNILKTEFLTEKAEIEASHNLEKSELREMIETIEEEEANKLKEMKELFEGERETTKNQNIEDLEQMKHELMKKIDHLDKQFEIKFNKYVSDTESKGTEYKQELKSNEEGSEKILAQQRQINRLREKNAYWNLKIQQNRHECKERNDKLAAEKGKIVRHYHDLKRKMQ